MRKDLEEPKGKKEYPEKGNAPGVFTAAWRTGKGYLLGIVGVTSRKAVVEDGKTAKELVKKMDRLSISPTAYEDPYLLDWQLATFLQKNAPEGLLAAGATLEVPGALGPAGGILGDPYAAPTSASRGWERLEGGLSLAVLPGGPGLLIAGDPERVYCLICSLPSGTGGTEVLRQAAREAARTGIGFLVGVTDGTDTTARGGILVMKGSRVETLDLGQGACCSGDSPLLLFI